MSFDDVREELRDSDENQRIASEDSHADNQGGPSARGSLSVLYVQHYC